MIHFLFIWDVDQEKIKYNAINYISRNCIILQIWATSLFLHRSTFRILLMILSPRKLGCFLVILICLEMLWLWGILMLITNVGKIGNLTIRANNSIILSINIIKYMNVGQIWILHECSPIEYIYEMGLEYITFLTCRQSSYSNWNWLNYNVFKENFLAKEKL